MLPEHAPSVASGTAVPSDDSVRPSALPRYRPHSEPSFIQSIDE